MNRLFVFVVFVLAACAGVIAGTPATVSPFAPLECDVNGDGIVSLADLALIRSRNGQPATGPSDPYDANHDGIVNVADVRYCQLRCTNANCSP